MEIVRRARPTKFPRESTSFRIWKTISPRFFVHFLLFPTKHVATLPSYSQFPPTSTKAIGCRSTPPGNMAQ
ncbi:hypothetical protein MRB53_034736 [Persea americana]|uniref:Uncharacterized protein n=1 Tax=Persea americana TaxID=3435 RepID=A0ACC2K2P7_PERAE|nr:hypothetical protein MRB53_034736 [Persea americana]